MAKADSEAKPKIIMANAKMILTIGFRTLS
jgi:hypothetical protein